MNDRQIHFDGSQNLANLLMPKKSEMQSNSFSIINELISDNPIENHRIFDVESAKNAVRKRVYPSLGKTTIKCARIESEQNEEMFSFKSESLHSSKTLQIIDEQELLEKAKYASVEQKELRDTFVGDVAAVKLNSKSEVIIFDEDVCELTVQQMMADFVPELK